MANEFISKNGIISKGDITLHNGIIKTDVSNGNIIITPNGTGNVILDGIAYPKLDGTAGQVLVTDGNGNLSWATGGGGGGITLSNNGSSLGTASSINFVGSEFTTTLNNGAAVVTHHPTLKIERIRINYTGTDLFSSFSEATSGVSGVNATNSGTADIQNVFTFTGYTLPPACIFFYGFDAVNQRYSIRSLPLAAGINYTVSTSGVATAPNTFGSFSNLRLSTTVSEVGGSKKSALPAIPAHAYIIFIMQG